MYIYTKRVHGIKKSTYIKHTIYRRKHDVLINNTMSGWQNRNYIMLSFTTVQPSSYVRIYGDSFVCLSVLLFIPISDLPFINNVPVSLFSLFLSLSFFLLLCFYRPSISIAIFQHFLNKGVLWSEGLLSSRQRKNIYYEILM